MTLKFKFFRKMELIDLCTERLIYIYTTFLLYCSMQNIERTRMLCVGNIKIASGFVPTWSFKQSIFKPDISPL